MGHPVFVFVFVSKLVNLMRVHHHILRLSSTIHHRAHSTLFNLMFNEKILKKLGLNNKLFKSRLSFQKLVFYENLNPPRPPPPPGSTSSSTRVLNGQQNLTSFVRNKLYPLNFILMQKKIGKSKVNKFRCTVNRTWQCFV